MAQNSPAIGIDLGTTYSCVGVLQHGKIEIIANDMGSRTTPSCVAFTPFQYLVGEAALNQATLNPLNTIFDVKRIIGRRYDDPCLIADRKLWPFEVVREDGDPRIKVDYKRKLNTFHPELISSMILTKMKETAEAFLGKSVKNAVITVPAYFNDSQRQATIDAGKIAGLNVLRILNEPTSACMAYRLDKDINKEKNILIYDLGGGTFDVSVVSVNGPIYKVRSVAGDAHLGGEDFNDRLVAHFLKVFQRKFSKDISTNMCAIRHLRVACETAKRALSCSFNAQIQIRALIDSIDFDATITRARFDELCGDLFRKTLGHVEDALKDAKLEKGDIDDIVLVGGSTRIPTIRKLLQEFFNGKELKKSINPDEAVAYGAAVQAAIINGDDIDSLKNLVLTDVTPFSLGMGGKNKAGVDDLMFIVIEKNSQIPVKRTIKRVNSEDDQIAATIPIYEGELMIASKNNFLGSFILSGLPKGKASRVKIQVTFEIDINGILNVTAREKSNDIEASIEIDMNKGRLNKDEILILTGQFTKFKEEDQAFRKKIKAKNDLECYCFNTKTSIEYDYPSSMQGKENLKVVISICDKAISWLEVNQNVETEVFERTLKRVEEKCVELLGKLYVVD